MQRALYGPEQTRDREITHYHRMLKVKPCMHLHMPVTNKHM